MPDRVDKPCAEKDTIPDQFFAPVAVTSPISPPDRRVADIRSRAAAMRRAVGPGIRTIIWRALRPLHTGVRLRSYRFPVPTRRRSPQITSSRARTTRIPQPEAQVAATRRHMCVDKPASGAVETMSEGIRRKGFFRYLWSQYGVYGAVTLVTVDVSAFVGSYIALTNNFDAAAFAEQYDYFNLLQYLGINPDQLTSKTTVFVTAFAVYKLLGPIRISTMLVVTPLLKRLFPSWGPRFKAYYQSKKEGIKGVKEKNPP